MLTDEKKQAVEFAIHCLKNNINMYRLPQIEVLKAEAEWLKAKAEKVEEQEKQENDKTNQ